MQTQQIVQSVSWITFATETVKIVGPAALALAGSWIALRYQSKVKQIEIDSQVGLKARELIFEGYQKKLESQTKDLKKLAAALGQVLRNTQLGDEDELQKAKSILIEAIAGSANPILHKLEIVEGELKRIGLLTEYRRELDFIREANKQVCSDWNSKDQVRDFSFTFFNAVNYLSIINQDLLDEKRHQLFDYYLPSQLRSARRDPTASE